MKSLKDLQNLQTAQKICTKFRNKLKKTIAQVLSFVLWNGEVGLDKGLGFPKSKNSNKNTITLSFKIIPNNFIEFQIRSNLKSSNHPRKLLIIKH